MTSDTRALAFIAFGGLPTDQPLFCKAPVQFLTTTHWHSCYTHFTDNHVNVNGMISSILQLRRLRLTEVKSRNWQEPELELDSGPALDPESLTARPL